MGIETAVIAGAALLSAGVSYFQGEKTRKAQNDAKNEADQQRKNAEFQAKAQKDRNMNQAAAIAARNARMNGGMGAGAGPSGSGLGMKDTLLTSPLIGGGTGKATIGG